jgi:glycosyltransferase involved in cell wall biosynthesis
MDCNKTIYHFGSLAGWPYTLAKGFRDKGYDSVNILSANSDTSGVTKSNSNKTSNRQLPHDRTVYNINDSKIVKFYKSFLFIYEVVSKGSIIHYHGGSILPKDIDTYIFKFFKIPMVKSWGGGDARITSEAVNLNPYFYRYEEVLKDTRIRQMLTRLANNNVYIATDPEMTTYSKPYFKQIYSFFAPINFDTITCVYPKANINKSVFLHIPTHKFVKGTIHIENAFKKLQAEGLEFEFKYLEPNLTQEQVKIEISKCDVYVDELRVGSYGVTAMEALASGKPTMTFIREDLVDKFPKELPFVNTNPDTIYDNLKDLIQNPEQLNEIGKRSRKYVEKYHDVNVVVEDMIKLYRKIGAKI